VSEDSGWTIDELARRAAEALASEGVRAPNGRVSEAPDRRVIRWYATIGLLDPPLRTRGRTARYGPRHLTQLVAVKRRQAEGHSLAAIQAELAGATDVTLHRVAGLPPTAVPSAPPVGVPAAPGATIAPAPAAPAPAAPAPAAPAPAAPAPAPTPAAPTPAPPAASAAAGPDRVVAGSGAPDGDRQPFWRAAPTAAAPPFYSPVRIVDAYDRLLTPEPDAGAVRPVYPVPLHPAATLTLAGRPNGADLAAIHAAARPLLDLLAARGLLPDPTGPGPTAPDSTEPPGPTEPPDPGLTARRPA